MPLELLALQAKLSTAKCKPLLNLLKKIFKELPTHQTQKEPSHNFKIWRLKSKHLVPNLKTWQIRLSSLLVKSKTKLVMLVIRLNIFRVIRAEWMRLFRLLRELRERLELRKALRRYLGLRMRNYKKQCLKFRALLR